MSWGVEFFLLLCAMPRDWDFPPRLSGQTATKEYLTGLRFYGFLESCQLQGSSLTCSLSAIKPLLPLLSSLGSVLVKGNSFPSTLESLSTLSLSLTPFPQNHKHTHIHTPTHILSLNIRARETHRLFFFFFWSFCPIISLPWNSEPLANYLLE